MILKFDFDYIGESEFFPNLLHFYAQGFEYSLEKSQSHIILLIKGTENALFEFSKSLEKLPNSVFLRAFKVESLENADFTPSKMPTNIEKMDFLTSLNANAYLNSGILRENEFDAFVNDEISFDKKSFQSIDKSNFNAILNEAFLRLKNGEMIFSKNALKCYKITLWNEKSKPYFLMPTRADAIKSAFVLNNENLKLLASLEKPLIELKFSAIFMQKNAPNFKKMQLKLAHNLFFFALCERLFIDNERFLAFEKCENSEAEFEASECEGRLMVLRGFDFVPKAQRELIFAKADKNLARISYILSSQKAAAFLVELSCEYDDLLLVEKSLNLLNLSLPRNANSIYSDICEDEVGTKLLTNFKQNFPLLSGEFTLKNNFFSLFGLLGQILGLDKDTQNAANRLLDLADNAKIPRGVKLDFKFKPKTREFDYARTLRSAMSFMLAGAEAENIAFGAVESLALFVRDIYDEVRQNGIARHAILTGSLFSHKSLAKNTLKHLKNSDFSPVPLFV